MTTEGPDIEDVVRIVSYLLAIVFALAITTAMASLISGPNGVPASPLELFADEAVTKKTWLFIVFLTFVIPFYQGASLALANLLKRREMKRGEPLFHFLALFTEAASFYMIALSLEKLNVFVAWLVFLNFVVDFFWLFFCLFILGELPKLSISQGEMPLGWWLLLDVAIIVYGVYFFYLGKPGDVMSTYYVLVIISFVRTFVDYATGSRFYFPHLTK